MKYVENVMEVITDGITVANLRRTDIQKVSTYDYKNYKHDPDDHIESEDGTIYFGSEKTYMNAQYPKMWEEYDSKWTYKYDGKIESGSDKECEMWERENGYETESRISTGNNETNFKESYYCHDYTDKENEFINKEYYNLLFCTKDSNEPMNKMYWLAGRYVMLYSDRCDFGIQSLDAKAGNCRVAGYGLSRCTDPVFVKFLALRPVVSINLISSGYSLEKVVGEDNKVSFNLVKDEN